MLMQPPNVIKPIANKLNKTFGSEVKPQVPMIESELERAFRNIYSKGIRVSTEENFSGTLSLIVNIFK